MSTHAIQFHDKIGKNHKIFLNICFELSKEFSAWEYVVLGPGYEVKLHPAVTLNMSVGM